MSKKRYRQNDVMNWILFALVFVLVAVLVCFVYSGHIFPQDKIELEDGVLDLTGIDCSDKVYHVVGHWDYYPEQLIFPDDFAAQQESAGISGEWHGRDKYGTHRLIVKGRLGTQYAISGYSVEYATRAFVDGTEAAAYGVVADSAEKSVPGTGNMMIPFRIGENGETEIIYQFSNFVHNEGGAIHEVYLSTPQNIKEFNESSTFPSLFLSSGLLALMIYFLLFAVTERRKTYYPLAFCCMLMALRDQVFLTNYLLPPGTSWYLNYRIVISVMVLIPVGFLLLFRSFYPAGKMVVQYIWLGLQAIVELLVIVTDTHGLVGMVAASYVICGAYLVYLLVCLFFKISKAENKRLKTEDALFLSGHAVLLAALLADLFLAQKYPFVAWCGYMPGAMMFFALLSAVATAMRARREREKLLESRIKGEMYEQMNDMNVDFFRKVAHELRTPLTVISGYAQLTEMQLKENPAGLAPENLKMIQSEALRLSDIVTALLEHSYNRKNETAFCNVEVKELLERVNAICTPICLKNNNRIEVRGDADFTVWGNGEMLLQIFINLVVNANRHTTDGIITISVSPDESEEYAVFRIRDTGTGISESDLPHIFEQGYSADGSSGLGLNICKEAVETHGGTIVIEQTGKDGTGFRFTVRKECTQ